MSICVYLEYLEWELMPGGVERASGSVSLHNGLPETIELCFQSLSLEDLAVLSLLWLSL